VQATGKEGGRFKYDKLEYNKAQKDAEEEWGREEAYISPALNPCHKTRPADRRSLHQPSPLARAHPK